MTNQIRQLYKNCQVYVLEGRSKQRQAPVIPDDLIRLCVFELVGVDLMQVGESNYLVLVDKKTGFRLCEYLKKTATEDVIRVLESWFFKYGIPSRLRSDFGPQFRKTFGDWCLGLGIQHETGSAYSPESNGLSERGVGVLKEMMKKCGAKKGKELEKLLFQLNSMSL